jgi:hypothetical protein
VSLTWSPCFAAEPRRSERRRESRFDTELEVRYRILDESAPPRHSSGVTVNLSAGGALVYDALETAPAGTCLELSIYWPVRLGQICPLYLLVSGRIIRREGSFFALRAERYEFRTYGSQAFHDDGAPARFQFDC